MYSRIGEGHLSTHARTTIRTRSIPGSSLSRFLIQHARCGGLSVLVNITPAVVLFCLK